jgi:tRNA(fMet)-specific endonuclease VapC
MFLLDTDALSLLHAGNSNVTAKANRVDPSEVATTIITRIEILRARFDFVLKAKDGNQIQRAQTWLEKSDDLLRRIQIVPLDPASAEIFDRVREDRKLRKVGRADLLIASIALSRRATLVTRNLRHFRMVPGLLIEDWAA